MLKMKVADISSLDAIDKLYQDCIYNLNNRQIYQWDYRYPNIDTYISSIKQNNQFIFEDDDLLIGSVILNEIQAKEWQSMPWEYEEGKNLIIHALAINPIIQGKGYGQSVLELCEAYGLKNGFRSIRLDAFSENPIAIKLYEKNQFKKVGEVNFDYKPVGHQRYFCYEKRIITK